LDFSSAACRLTTKAQGHKGYKFYNLGVLVSLWSLSSVMSSFFSISFLYPVFLWLLLLLPLFLALGWPPHHAPDRRQRWLAVVVRLMVLLGLILGLAGSQFERPTDLITTVFVLDASDSIRGEDRSRAEAFIREALAEKPDRDQAAVILFGGDALVERLPRPEAALPALASTPLKNATDIEEALRLALALLPNEGGRRIVLLSDGQETEGEARRLLDLAVARQVEISVYPLGLTNGTGQPEVLVEQVTAPSQARQGQLIPVEVVVAVHQSTEANLRLLADGTLVESRAVRLVQGRNRFGFNLPAPKTGFHRFRAEIEAPADTRPQNNWGAAFTTVYGPPQVLVVEGQPGEAVALNQALEAAGIRSTLTQPAALPGTLPGLAVYDAIILSNVPAQALPNAIQEALVTFVRDLGRGLVMVGGPESYGAGSYLRSPLEKALPVDMEVRGRSREPNIALVLAVDKSGSMGACHCDNPDLNQNYTRVPSGLPKIDIAKEAIFQAAAVLGNMDYLGVVSFDSSAHWDLEPSPGVSPRALEAAIGQMPASGQTNIYAGLAAAEQSLTAIPARLKHIILLTDGWSHSGAYDELTTRLAEQGITLSVVAAGGGSAEYLADLARKGGGQYYPAATMSDVPQIFLKETVRAVGSYIIEEPFTAVPLMDGAGQAASPILAGLDLVSSPPLLGYNGTTPKTAARLAVLTPRGDPLLATWQYGLGRSAAWTTDLSGRWAKNWLDWPDFARFVGQLVNWTLPRPGDEQLDLTTSVSGNQVALSATLGNETQAAASAQVNAKLLTPAGEAVETELRPSEPNRYQATITLPGEGVYLAQVTAYTSDSTGADKADTPIASQTTGVVASYSAEYAYLAPEGTLLPDLTTATGGQMLSDPRQAFVHNLALGRQSWPIWPVLLLTTALLFPFDVALRRLRLGQREWKQTQSWLGEHLPGRRSTPAVPLEPATPSVRAFRQAQQRARRSASMPPPAISSSPFTPVSKPPEPASTGSAPPAASSPPAASPAEDDTIARLRAAKKRARR
jgi:Mg-chelatase subunit ChlD